MKSDHTEGGLPSNLELTAENRLLFDRTLGLSQFIEKMGTSFFKSDSDIRKSNVRKE